MLPARRRFLKAGIVGSAALAIGGAWHLATRAEEIDAVLAAVGTAILAGVLPDEISARRAASAELVHGMHRAIAGLSAGAQAELDQLFGLLALAPSRILLTGIWHSWHEVSAAEATRFLAAWRGSPLALLQSAYAALHDIALGAWYGDSSHWAAIGYPGPPSLS